jgi:hypothetical protein
MTAKMDLIVSVDLKTVTITNVTAYIVDSEHWSVFLVGEDVLTKAKLMPEQNLPETHSVIDMQSKQKSRAKVSQAGGMLNSFMDLSLDEPPEQE